MYFLTNTDIDSSLLDATNKATARAPGGVGVKKAADARWSTINGQEGRFGALCGAVRRDGACTCFMTSKLVCALLVAGLAGVDTAFRLRDWRC